VRRWYEEERPYEMLEVEGQPGDWVYIGGGRRDSPWRRWPAFLVGGRRMCERVERMAADDGAVWLVGLMGRKWMCDCGRVEKGGCHGWALREALAGIRRRVRHQWVRVAGGESEVGLLRRERVLGGAEGKAVAGRVLADRLNLPAVGINLKRLLLARPGRLGEFLRVFPSCRFSDAPSQGLRFGRDSMPLPLVR
jgi:hypothetical protein